MATLTAFGGESFTPPNIGGANPASNTANLSTGQTGNGVSTNIVDRGISADCAVVKIVTTVGATPTVTIALEGSPGGVDWFPIAYADPATPTTVSVATFTITTAATTFKLLQANQPWRYVRLNYSANTNVTLTADVWVF